MKKYHPLVWTILIGTVFARGASFMAVPFLALYLSKTEGMHPALIGLIIGIGPLTGTLGGFIGGHLSDRFGRKVVMLSAIFVWALVYVGFAFSSHALAFLLLNAVNGLCRAFFEPTTQALLADVTTKELRHRVFSMRYMAINIGAAIGPLAGAKLGVASSTTTFLVAGSFYIVYGLVLAVLLTKYRIERSEQEKKPSLAAAFKIVSTDIPLFLYIVAGALVNIGYSQIDGTLSQYVGQSFEDGVNVFAQLLFINAVAVIVLQVPLSKISERFKVMHAMMIGSGFFALGFVGFALATHEWMFYGAMLVLTIGEILSFPASSVFIDEIAPEAMRGTYFGAAQFRNIGHSVGPIAGGWMLSEYGGPSVFYVMALLVAASIYLFLLGQRSHTAKKLKTN